MQNPSPGRPDVAWSLLNALDKYRRASVRLKQDCQDNEAVAVLGRHIDAVRAQAKALPELAAPTTRLVIAHSELVCTVLQNGVAPLDAERVQDAESRHALAVDKLRTAASQFLGTPARTFAGRSWGLHAPHRST